MAKKIIFLSLTVCFVCSSGCSSYFKKLELEKVAKDWCLTIRASQVIPVYPLTEDIQPGDVFLVTTPVGKQAKRYNERGFLPLDNLMTRLDVNDDYSSFYEDSYLKSLYKNES